MRARALPVSVVAVALVVLAVGHGVQQRAIAARRTRLEAAASRERLPPLPDDLPAPVRRYLDYAFPDGPRPLGIVRLRNSGVLRTDPSSPRWMSFTATQLATSRPHAFLWEARVAHGLLGVADHYANGHSGGQVTAFAAVTVDEAHAIAAVDSGALHRYLAEAVWYPDALWPGHGLSWTPIDARRARATLVDGGQRVSLEFRFAPDGAVESIHTPARWGRFGGGYRQVAWEGRFSGSMRVQGVRVPARGEVGWYLDGRWRPVWRGRIDSIAFDARPH